MKQKDVLIVGRGGREHALAWKLRQSPQVGVIFCAPGNGGTTGIAENVPISEGDVDALAIFAEARKVHLTVVGPESSLEAGVVDRFHDAGLRIFGPSKAAARVETSKAFARRLMRSACIPCPVSQTLSPEFDVERAAEDAHKFIDVWTATAAAPIVIKLDGLAAGKGVVEKSREEAHALVDRLFVEERKTLVIEEHLVGEELSVQALCHGTDYLLLPVAQDHKRIFDGDQGENTGGMGVIAPVPWLKPAEAERLGEQVIAPLLRHLHERGTSFEGVLKADVMLTADGAKVLEYNVRFGDPEAEAVLPLLACDLLALLDAVTDGDMAGAKEIHGLHGGYAASVILASKGYPGAAEVAFPITGIPADEDGRVVFHAGTAEANGTLITMGGRVFAATAFGDPTLDLALRRAYEAAGGIRFPGAHCRQDIGRRALERVRVG